MEDAPAPGRTAAQPSAPPSARKAAHETPPAHPGRTALRGDGAEDAGAAPEHEPELRVQRHSADVPLPSRGHPDDAGLDLTAMAVTRLRPRVFAVDTGVSVQPPAGFYCEVVPRSSIVRTDFIQANGVGVIDPAYRGRVTVVLRYLGDAADGGEADARALVGTRVAQLLVRRLEPVRVTACEALDDTARGSGGFGSTGR